MVITFKPIREVSKSGSSVKSYKQYLSANDYYSEGNKVTGYIRGEGAKMLGIEGQAVTNEVFNALWNNQHPLTGEKLRPKNSKVKFNEATISAPKSVSVAALVGGDKRLIEAFERVAESTRQRLEYYAGHRENKGKNYNKEIFVRTGNSVVVVYHHTDNRLLEPQLHAHMAFSNHTWSEERQEWLALQPRMMGDMSKAEIKQQGYRELAAECEKLGYEVEWLAGNKGFRLADIDPVLDTLYSVRSQQKEKFIERYSKLFGQEPTKKRVEHFIQENEKQAKARFASEYAEFRGYAPSRPLTKAFVKDWRIDKMLNCSSELVALKQRETITDQQFDALDRAVRNAIAKSYNDNQPKQSQERMAEGQSESIGTSQAIAPDRNNTRNGQSNTKAHKQSRIASRQAAVSRMEAMRRYRRGIMIARALQGNPALLITSQLVKNARRKNNETK